MVVAKCASANLKPGVSTGGAWGQAIGRERSQRKRLRGGEHHSTPLMNCRLYSLDLLFNCNNMNAKTYCLFSW